MSNINVGARAQNLDIGAEVPAITRVNLVVDSDHMYTAGDDTGRTIEVECPWGTQAMANNILATVSGVQYTPYTAERAMVDPAFEPGDAVSVGGVYSQIISADCTYNGAGLMNISAPDLDEIDDEYPAQQTQSNSIKRQLAYTRSLITKTAEQIRLSVEGMEGQLAAMDISLDEITLVMAGLDSAMSAIEQTVGSIELSVSSANGSTVFKLTADGAELSSQALNLTVPAVNVTGTLSASQINLSGSISWNDLSSSCKSHIGDGLTEDDIYTYIDDSLVSSPTIAGGVFMDYDQEVSLYLDATRDGSSYGLILEDDAGEIFTIWSDSGFGEVASISLRGFEFLSNVGGTIYAWGDWDFSNANVTGL